MDENGLVASFDEFVAECKKAREGEFSTENGGLPLYNTDVCNGQVGIVFYREDKTTHKEYYHPVMVRIRDVFQQPDKCGEKFRSVCEAFDKGLRELFLDIANQRLPV
jgi:hypothetical protein